MFPTKMDRTIIYDFNLLCEYCNDNNDSQGDTNFYEPFFDPEFNISEYESLNTLKTLHNAHTN